MAQEQDKEDFDSGQQGDQARWEMELRASEKWLRKWHKDGQAIVKRYVDDRTGTDGNVSDSGYRLNAFSSNVQTVEAMMYGRVPTVDVSRRFADADDDTARVAGEMLERLLNCDIERANDPYRHVLGYALSDRLRSGIAVARVRYEADIDQPETSEDEAAEGDETQEAQAEGETKYEDAVVDYVYWEDFRYSPCRTWHDCRWVAFKAQMTRNKLKERFGKEKALKVPMNSQKAKGPSDQEVDALKNDPWSRADVWEIWSKEDRKVYWVVLGMQEVLDEKDDPLELFNFFPCPRPMIANPTTTAFVPTPDFVLSKDIYNELDDVSDRINALEQAIKVVGGYDDSMPALAQMLESPSNKLVPISGWPAFAEAGGMKNRIEWFPLEMVVMALDKLRDYRSELLSLVDRISGQADIVRGEQMDNGTPGEAQIKARFASVRMQALLDEFSRFASDLQNLRAEVISNLFDVETIIERSNAKYLPQQDQALVPQAAQLIKDKVANYRIEVKPESVSMQDFAAEKSEAMELLGGITSFVQAAMPVMQVAPAAVPFLLQLLQATIAHMRGAKEFEGIIDQAIGAAEQAAAQPQPQQGPQIDQTKVIAQQMKGQQDAQKIQLQTQSELARIQAETQALKERRINDAAISVQEEKAKHAVKTGGVAPAPQPGGMT